MVQPQLGPTRLIPSSSLSSDKANVWLKLECELPTGSFKVRGALYSLAKRLERGTVSEVVAASTGNHGAAVAWAAQQLGVNARIFLPVDANPTKVGKIRSFGAAITESGTTLTDAIRGAEEYAKESGAFMLADAKDVDVPIGAGAIGTEVVQQLPSVTTIYVPVGDTALIRGIATQAKRGKPEVKIIGVQAEEAPAYYRSWKSGKVETTETANTIADGLATTDPLQPNVDAIRELVDDFELVSEDDMLDAIAYIQRHEDLLVEPASAAVVAAYMRERTKGDVVLIISGQNISPEVQERVAERE